ncbi:DNA-binding transcriptional ArsR family regulator [Nocardia transvalensis]|uniref:DNA-binding transcriptional ArsR family regulator n=1 Tax=Nocardia transvalensis TaxID=37333 RepID=A0A7W9UG67_9NOCA|nr:metalloregulator ArsR/SmtB family transcription factor [Nocardia transvalensis]MBB5911400.1 DNA-binding transcriptional ArsR family regulator [Nocardia transvalensis]
MTSPSPEQIFDALGDPVRRSILEMLATAGERPAGEIVAAVQRQTKISQPGVSQHLRVLRDAGLVTVRAEGTRRFYALDQEGVDAAQAWLARLAHPIEQFEQPMDALATEVARGKRARKAAGPGHSAEQAADRHTRPA